MRPRGFTDGLEAIAMIAFCALVLLSFAFVIGYLLLAAALAIAG